MKKMLDYFGFKSLKEFGETYGFYNLKDAKRFLKEMYEEDILWD